MKKMIIKRILPLLVLILVLIVNTPLAFAVTSFTTWKSLGFASIGIAVDSAGNVYVSDNFNSLIQKFDSAGNFITNWDGSGGPGGQLVNPTFIAVDSAGNVYVSDDISNQIQKFESDGDPLAHWGSLGSGDGQFNSPNGIAVDSAGNVYVVDTGNNRIQKFNSVGGFLAQWGSVGSGNGQLNSPKGIAVDSAGNVYVADSNNNRMQKFNSVGVFLAKWGSTGSGDGQLNTPKGIAVDSAGNIYVADTGNDRIQKFNSTGDFLAKWGSTGSGAGQFDSPNGIAVDSAGNIYVADSNNNRIQLHLETIAPTISSINRQTPAGASTNATSVIYRVTFSEAVTGVDTSDFTLTTTGTASGSVASVSATSGTAIDVTVSTITGVGTLQLDLNASGTGIADINGNAIETGYTNGQTYSVDGASPTITPGAVNRSSNTAGTIKFTSSEAGEYYYAVVENDAAAPAIDTSGVGTACTTSETTITDPAGLTDGAKDIYIKVKDGAGNVSNALKLDIAAYVAPSSGTGGGGTSTAPTPTNQTVNLVVNGKEQVAGKEIKTTEDGKPTVTIELNNTVTNSKIDEAIKNNTAGVDNLIQIPVTDTKSEVVKIELTGDIVKKLEENTFDVSVKRDNVEYVIPAEEFTISKVAEDLGVLEKDLEDIKIEIQITKLDESVVAKYKEVAKANGAELVFPPIQFEVVAKTIKADGTKATVEINKFSNYVERVLEIPAGVDPSKITTGIVFNPDGTYSHVPTELFQKDGKWYAKLNSLTNSNYSVIWNQVTVKSVENHWAKDAVNDMASRLVIFSPETFAPEKAITRADFAEYIVRALGLYREGSTHVNKFNDVNANGDRTLGILIASEHGIITGYTDGTFKPDALITREEAMTMYQRAMKVTNLIGSDTGRYQNYTDFSKVSGWATSYVKEVLAAHVFNGTAATTISPKSSLTYAEAAQAIKNLLVESNLINE